MREVTLVELKYIVAVHDAKHIQVAAEKLSKSKSTVRKAVESVEEKLGFTLFRRANLFNQKLPTEKGAKIIKEAKNVLLVMKRFNKVAEGKE